MRRAALARLEHLEAVVAPVVLRVLPEEVADDPAASAAFMAAAQRHAGRADLLFIRTGVPRAPAQGPWRPVGAPWRAELGRPPRAFRRGGAPSASAQ
jgi:hypothetical protein